MKRIGVINLLKAEGTPESVSRIENIEELLNAVKDFIEGQEDVINSEGSLSEFLEDVALISELDKDKNETQKKVSLMTIHLAKGLEFPHVYIVGLEEDLFPSALSSTTRSDLEEERRLFYVALTRAEKKITLTYAKTRYRWGKLNDCEPSRFINEIDSNYTNHNFSKSKSLFQTSSSSNSLRFKKPEKKSNLKPLGKKKLVTENISENIEGFKDLKIGDYIIHNRFGKGEVIETEGVGFDKKAEVKFDTSGIKKILLKFAKYEITSN